MDAVRFVVWILPFIAIGVGMNAVRAQSFPSKSIRIITSSPGGSHDLLSRLIGQEIAGPLGQPVVVDNRSGDASESVAKAPPDGHTLLVGGSSHWLLPFLREKVPFDPVKDFAPISLVASTPGILVVHPSLPVKSVKELIAFASNRPGMLNYSSGSTGAPNHLGAELFKVMARVNIVRVPYKGVAPALNAALSGEVQVSFPIATLATPHIKSGKLTGLAVTSVKPSALAPGLPTIADSGLPGYESATIIGMFAPAKSPAAVITRVNQEIVRALSRADVKEQFLRSGLEPVGSSSEELAAAVKSEMTILGKLIKDLGIRDE